MSKAGFLLLKWLLGWYLGKYPDTGGIYVNGLYRTLVERG